MARLLVVEDEWIVAEYYAMTLREANHSVVGPYATVREALAALDSNHIDAAVLDVQLRNETSYPVAEKLAQMGIPFVFLSGYDERVLPPTLLGNRVLSKPVEPSGLLAAAERMTPARH